MNKNDIRNIIELGRFRFLAGGFFLYVMGALLASVSGVQFSFFLFFFGYAIMMPGHLSLSYSNNYFDRHVDQYTQPISISGGTRILIENPHLVSICKYVAIGLMTLSIIVAALATIFLSYSWWFFAFIVFGNMVGWFYTAPPFRLAYRGLGEIANMINMGLLMPGIGYWTMKGSLDMFYLVFAGAFFFYGLEFMIIVETPDMEGDSIGKKKTLIAAKGRRFGYQILLISLTIASVYYLALFFLGIYQQYLNYLIVFLLSLVPLGVALYGWLQKPFQRDLATRLATRNMMMLILLVILISIYFVFLI
jgi:1,4-dihydroxy-2-naphthoate octaprenyltransferase